MKKLLIFICGIFLCMPISSQEMKTYKILKIKKLKNDCYRLTAKNNGKKYAIYTHYDGSSNSGDIIKCHENLELMIFPFFKKEHMSNAEFKKMVGMQVLSEDSACYVDVTLPLNWQSINIDYYGNTLKIKRKMEYYTLDVNGVYKRQE